MIVVSNTSPITNLAAIGQFDLLQKLFSTVRIPEAVWDELNAGSTTWPGCREVADSPWVERCVVESGPLVVDLAGDLGRGEAESITLSLQIEADTVLLDEAEGRRRARRLGLRPMGVCGVLLGAKAHGHVQSVRPHLDALRQNALTSTAKTLARVSSTCRLGAAPSCAGGERPPRLQLQGSARSRSRLHMSVQSTITSLISSELALSSGAYMAEAFVGSALKRPGISALVR